MTRNTPGTGPGEGNGPHVGTGTSPVGRSALLTVVRPEQFDFVATTTTIGGTVGGCITYAGAHRLLDSRITGPDHGAALSRDGVGGPIGFGILLWVAWRRRDLLNGYGYPRWLLAVGVLAWLVALYLGYHALLLGDL